MKSAFDYLKASFGLLKQDKRWLSLPIVCLIGCGANFIASFLLGSLNLIPVVALLVQLILMYVIFDIFIKVFKGEKIKYSESFVNSLKKNYKRGLAVNFMVCVNIALMSFLLIVPGIIKFYSIGFAPFIAIENEDKDASECIEMSAKLMEGKKMKLFILDLLMCVVVAVANMLITFVGTLTLGIGFVLVILIPVYIIATRYMFYKDLVEESK
jgi:uncharacterized membrane protein